MNTAFATHNVDMIVCRLSLPDRRGDGVRELSQDRYITQHQAGTTWGSRIVGVGRERERENESRQGETKC